MPVGIRIYTEPQTSQYRRQGELVHTAWSETMSRALSAALRYAKRELAGAGPDRTLYLYDALGGLRASVGRRANEVSVRKTP